MMNKQDKIRINSGLMKILKVTSSNASLYKDWLRQLTDEQWELLDEYVIKTQLVDIPVGVEFSDVLKGISDQLSSLSEDGLEDGLEDRLEEEELEDRLEEEESENDMDVITVAPAQTVVPVQTTAPSAESEGKPPLLEVSNGQIVRFARLSKFPACPMKLLSGVKPVDLGYAFLRALKLDKIYTPPAGKSLQEIWDIFYPACKNLSYSSNPTRGRVGSEWEYDFTKLAPFLQNAPDDVRLKLNWLCNLGKSHGILTRSKLRDVGVNKSIWPDKSDHMDFVQSQSIFFKTIGVQFKLEV